MLIQKRNERISFFQDCMDGFFDYVRDCADKCGHCKNNNICTKDAGYCPKGCKSNFLAPMCQGNRIKS